jgi:agmatinase
VYITFDLDSFDPSIIYAITETLSPGLMLVWDYKFYVRVFEEKNVVGFFDIVELLNQMKIWFSCSQETIL